MFSAKKQERLIHQTKFFFKKKKTLERQAQPTHFSRIFQSVQTGKSETSQKMQIVGYLGRFERNRKGRLGDRKRERRRLLGRGESRTQKKSRVGESERNRRLGRSTCRVARACGPAISRGSLARQAPRTS